MSLIVQTEAFLLRSVDYSESHRILTFLSPEEGLLSVMVLGAKKSKERGLGLLDYLKCLHLEIEHSNKSSLPFLKNLKLLEHYPWIEKDYEKTHQALQWCALIRQVLQPGLEVKEIYFLLREALKALQSLPITGVDLVFLKKLMSLLGYDLDLTSCKDCDKKGEGTFFFNPSWGALLCQDCASVEGALRISKSFSQDFWSLENLHLIREEQLKEVKEL
ncbi:MAG: DNA repair protein RecO, partial [Deltaproteobacteria bacterium]|nr:DNA repair protein RecO [Deltaproteobacteria bacterium]